MQLKTGLSESLKAENTLAGRSEIQSAQHKGLFNWGEPAQLAGLFHFTRLAQLTTCLLIKFPLCLFEIRRWAGTLAETSAAWPRSWLACQPRPHSHKNTMNCYEDETHGPSQPDKAGSMANWVTHRIGVKFLNGTLQNEVENSYLWWSAVRSYSI